MIKRQLNKDIPTDRLRLQASERNQDWSDNLFSKFKDSISQSDIKFYPNLNKLYSKLRDFYNFDNIILGSGSDKCIEYFVQAHSRTHSKLVIFDPCFPMYFIYGEVYGMEVVKVSQKDLTIPYQDYLDVLDDDCIAIITNPSSPLGQSIDTDFIKAVLEKNIPTLVDEAYIEFSSCTSSKYLLTEFSNIFITRTFSKALGSAGVRLGVVTSSEKNIELLQQFRPMFELNSFTCKWAELLVDNYVEVEEYVNKVKAVRNKVVELCRNKDIEVIDGECNWIHIIKDELPDNIILKTDCKIPGDSRNWLRLQITSNFNDYLWL